MKFSYGPIVRYFRKRHIKNKYDVEPEWRRTRQDAHHRLREAVVSGDRPVVNRFRIRFRPKAE